MGAENDLARQAALLSPESRLTLSIVLARGADLVGARRLLEPLWRAVKIEGRTASVPDSLASGHYFRSAVRPAALLLEATLAVDPAHPLVAPLFETVVTRGRTQRSWWWNTQDYAWACARSAWIGAPPGGPPDVRVRPAPPSCRPDTTSRSPAWCRSGATDAVRVSLSNGRPTPCVLRTHRDSRFRCGATGQTTVA